MPLLPFSASAFDMVALRDSVGVERKNGKVYVQHRVEPKETLYALSRKYGVSVARSLIQIHLWRRPSTLARSC
ncbi:LysM repeat-containing protein [Pontibacter sp. BAB1700]|nr:LysM repeat-containing protein [Pontibacter sp. BAB1700]